MGDRDDPSVPPSRTDRRVPLGRLRVVADANDPAVPLDAGRHRVRAERCLDGRLSYHADGYYPRTMHWDGTSWTTVPNPLRLDRWTGLNAVDASGPDDVWAVG